MPSVRLPRADAPRHQLQRQLRRSTLLPAVLLTALLASGLTLWAMPEPDPMAPTALATPVALVLPAVPGANQLDQQLVQERASRSRRFAVEGLQRDRARAAAARKAAAARAAAQAAEEARNATVCPAPTASFIDSWGYSRSGGRAHKGTDMMAAYGEPIYAVRTGTVQTSSGGNGGTSIYLTDESGDRYYYAHNAENLVSSGQSVVAGDLIARVGATGNASGGPSHLHFELQPGGGSAVRSYSFLRGIC